MAKKPDKVTETVMPGKFNLDDGQPVDLVKTTTDREFNVGGHIEVDFDALRASGDLEPHELNMLQFGYPGSPIVFVGAARIGINGKTVCIGIQTGGKVYPKNMFFLRPITMKCCTPMDESSDKPKKY